MPWERRLCRIFALAVALAALIYAAAAPAAPTNRVSTVAGNGTTGSTGDGGPATSAELSIPTGVTLLADGGYLIADQESNEVRRVFPDGHIATIAGSGPAGFSGDGGPATAATMGAPSGAAMLPDGTVVIADSNNNRIRAVAPNGTINTVVGNGSATFGGDGGPAANAQVNFPFDIAVQPDGGYLIADVDNARIRRVAPDGTITTVAGNGAVAFGGDGGPATAASLNKPSGVTVAPGGGFFIGDTSNNRVRRVAPDGTISTVAGTGTAGDTGDGGPATAAELNQPIGIAVAPGGGFAIADRMNNKVKLVDGAGTISTLVGTGTAGFNGDGQLGPQTQLNQPFDVYYTAEGDLLIDDTLNNRIRLLDSGEPPPPATITLDPASTTRAPGDPNTVTATVRNTLGAPSPGVAIHFSISGANPGGGTATSDQGGSARITWPGVHTGSDVVTAFGDSNGNGSADPGEPTATATVVWSLPAPKAGRTFNIDPVSGVVKIRAVRGHARSAHAAAAFTALTHAEQVPLTTEVDTTGGRARMTVAASGGKLQTGDFYQGVYRTTQPRAGRQIVTELALSAPLPCKRSSKGKLAGARARSRHLWADVHGRFRTRGRHSTATVRGTQWLTKDTCSSTTTVVKRGSVVVRDLVKRRNVVVKQGRRYIARTRH